MLSRIDLGKLRAPSTKKIHHERNGISVRPQLRQHCPKQMRSKSVVDWLIDALPKTPSRLMEIKLKLFVNYS
jgi:hypothetical protein